ncbi:MAG: chemotaxis protein CheX [Oscillospiraceae bacterium]|nr:chemotaxis protein CheX [Oscillospiraceae bacterium]
MNVTENPGGIFSATLSEVALTFTGLNLEKITPGDSQSFEEYTGLMAMNSKQGGVLMISMGQASMNRFCSLMLGVVENEVAEADRIDALCEVVNMTAGAAKARFAGTDFMFTYSQPFVIKGSEMLVTKHKTRVFTELLTGGGVEIRLMIVY